MVFRYLKQTIYRLITVFVHIYAYIIYFKQYKNVTVLNAYINHGRKCHVLFFFDSFDIS